MTPFLITIAGAALIAQTLLGLSFLISCIWEDEKRASIIAGIQFVGMLVPLVLLIVSHQVGFFDTRLGFGVLVIFLILGAVVFFLLWRRSGWNARALKGTKGFIVGNVKRFDEREHVFARNRALRPGSEQYGEFYASHPDLEPLDTKRRNMGGPLGHPGTIDKPNDRPNVAATLGSLSIPLHLSTTEKVKPSAHPELKGKITVLSPREAAVRAKGYAKSLGADLVGITEINPLWVYSHKGEIFHENWDDWGKEIDLNHQYAVVFAVEMNFRMIAPAPHTPTTIESMGNYAMGAFIATQLASFIANLGYSATAHHLRHYEAMMVPLAVDAGLGEGGRLGYLLTKEYGARVRLGAVTTDLPMAPDKPIDIGGQDFCRVCKKCAICCPSNSIPIDDPADHNGVLKWKLNSETCFEYWAKVGTDCNICMRVCPWSHADTLPHRFIKAFVTRNSLSRRLFSLLDDVFYGKKPTPKAPLKWARYDSGLS